MTVEGIWVRTTLSGNRNTGRNHCCFVEHHSDLTCQAQVDVKSVLDIKDPETTNSSS